MQFVVFSALLLLVSVTFAGAAPASFTKTDDGKRIELQMQLTALSPVLLQAGVRLRRGSYSRRSWKT